MFYEKNSIPSNNNNNNNNSPTNNGYYQSINTSRRSSFQQTAANPSTNKTLNNIMNRQGQQVTSRPNLASATIFNKQSTSATSLADRMQRSKSYKDLFDPPSAATTNPHHVYYQQQTSSNRPSQNAHPSTGSSPINNNNTNNNNNNLYPYYSSAYYYQSNGGGNASSPTAIVGSMIGNASSHSSIEQHSHLSGLTEFQRRQQQSLQHSSSSNNLMLDDVSSSSTVSHLPKPPPGIPSQNARYIKIMSINFSFPFLVSNFYNRFFLICACMIMSRNVSSYDTIRQKFGEYLCIKFFLHYP